MRRTAIATNAFSVSAASMYNAHEPLTVKPNRECDAKRQADDLKTKQKMEFIRSKMKPETSKVNSP